MMQTRSSGSSNTAQARSPAKRTRRKNSKSRDGCSRCKSRRVKCDETRPFCGNCLKLGRQCPGFQRELRWSHGYEQGRQSHHIPDPPMTRGFDDQPSRLVYRRPIVSAVENSSGCPNSSVDLDTDDWLLSLPTTWQATTLQESPALNQDDSSYSINISKITMGWESRSQSVITSNSKIMQTPTHLPTMLIEHWFGHVCPMWSTFDSEVNWNRRLARGTWNTSKPVFYAIQFMSAACLIDHMPQLHETLKSLRTEAISSINEGISEARRRLDSPRVAADLVFAVFALGTSLHWTRSSFSELSWLEHARELLSMWKLELSKLDELLHDYFCQALTYWEMIITTGNRDSICASLDIKRKQYQARLRRVMQLPDGTPESVTGKNMAWGPDQKLFGTRPNSWCGVSKEVIDVFGQVLALCRGARRYGSTQAALTISLASNAICDISLAHELKGELLAMDFNALILREEEHGYPVETRDDDTPISHLLLTAEAYRQAAILQLHLTFSDLEATSPEIDSSVLSQTHTQTVDGMKGKGQPHTGYLLSMALKLVSILEQIPIQSGSRCIHPLLYLSAATGLKHEAWPDAPGDDNIGGGTDIAHNVAGLNFTHEASQFIPRSALEVSRARRFVWERLNALQQALPNSASDSTIQLVKSIWREYDNSDSGKPASHWLDVMDETGLRISLW